LNVNVIRAAKIQRNARLLKIPAVSATPACRGSLGAQPDAARRRFCSAKRRSVREDDFSARLLPIPRYSSSFTVRRIHLNFGRQIIEPSLASLHQQWSLGGLFPIDANGPTQPFVLPSSDFLERPLFETFRDVAARHPNNVAVVDRSTSLNFAELKNAAEEIAAGLRHMGSCEGAIGIFMAHSVSFIAAILGCLAAGRPYIALDQRYPLQRNLDIITRAKLAIVLIDDGAAPLPNLSLPNSIQTIGIGSLRSSGLLAEVGNRRVLSMNLQLFSIRPAVQEPQKES
jgi:hypothetical protein